jgi:transcriptional regulator with XRE-family HTH domain
MGQTIREAFAQWLQGQLRSQGWLVSDFAREVGVRPSAVYRWTAGQRTPTDAQIDRIAEVLRVSPDVIWAELAREGITPIGAVPKSGASRRPSAPPAPAVPPEERPFGRWLRAQVAERGWSAGHLARQLDLDVVTVRAWLTGVRTPASIQFAGLAKALGVKEDTILRQLAAETGARST